LYDIINAGGDTVLNKWTIEQQNAININNKNILVSASAGSGKTAVLVERVISKVINLQIDIDKLLVVTFTKASSTELKERLLNAIYSKLKEDKNNYFLKKQLEKINRATITTIHSFCLEVIKNNFYNLGIDPNISIIDDNIAKLLLNKSFIEVLEEEYKNYSNNTFGLYQVLELFNSKDEEFLEAMNKIYSFISSFEYPLKWLKSSVELYNITDINKDLCSFDFGRNIYSDSISDLKILLEKTNKLREELSKDVDYIKYVEVIDQDIENIKRCINCSYLNWDKLYQNLSMIAYLSMPRNKVANMELKEKFSYFRKNILKKDIDTIKNKIYTTSENILKDLKIGYKYLNFIYNYILKVDEKYKLYKQKNNGIDFSDIEHLALKVLINEDTNEKTEQAMYYVDKFEEVYIDEYQDTSYIQEAILNSVSKVNNRFMVGDIKQSIYKFRQAMPEIFNKKYLEYTNYIKDIEDNNVKVILAKNFRSRKNVLNSINYIFSQIMSLEIGQCDYSKDEILKFGANYYEEDETTDYSTEINILDLKENEITDTDYDIEDNEVDLDSNNYNESIQYINELKTFEIESNYIAKKINELVGNYNLYDSKNKVFYKARYKDIVILLRNTKDKANILENTLNTNNIPVYSDNGVNLYSSDEINLVLSFLKIIDNPMQDIEMVSIMYSIVGKFTLDEIYEIKNTTDGYIYHSLLEYIKNDNNNNENNILYNKVSSFLNLINTYINYTKIYNISEILIRLYKETSIYNHVILFKNSKIAKINLDSLINISSKFDSNSSIYSFINYIESLKEKNQDSTTAKIIGENENVVRIMTIHKSKGLEFPIVIIANTSSNYSNKDISNSTVLHQKLGIGINILDEDNLTSYPSIIKTSIKDSMIKDLKSEELRMLYVAMTRAKEKLIIFGTLKDYQKKIDNLFIIYNNSKIDSSIVLKNNCYLDNILMGLNKYNVKNNKMFSLNVVSVKHKDNISNVVVEDKYTRINIKDKLENEIINIKDKFNIENYIKKYENNLEFKYEYIELTKLDKKVSVSELKKSNNEFLDLKEEIILKKPECLIDSNIKTTAVRKGTLVHFLLEHLDFKNINNKEDIIKFVNNLVLKNYITNQDAKEINIDKIFKFLNSKIGIEIKNSKIVKREVEFVLKDSSKSQSLIQGVIDLYFLNNDNSYTLIDFKTDNLTNEQDYIDRYKIQLDIYKEAIEKISNVKVSKVFIYSFKLDKEIEVK
jgi:ATP-dependent helicase/nuclease subunit A